MSIIGKSSETKNADINTIVTMLIKGKGKILSRTEIIEYLWDNEMFVDDNTLSVNIRRIRAKLEKIGIYNYIHTKHGQGYSV